MSEETARRIAQAALRILEEEGPQAVSMRRVARDAGVTAMAIYHYYPNREALLRGVTDLEFARLAGSFQTITSRGSIPARLLAMAEAYLDYALAHPRLFSYVFSDSRPGARQFPRDFRAGLSPTANLLAATVAEGMQTGRLKKDDVWEVTLSLTAHAHGYAALYLGGRLALPEADFRALYRRSMRRLMNGLKP